MRKLSRRSSSHFGKALATVALGLPEGGNVLDRLPFTPRPSTPLHPHLGIFGKAPTPAGPTAKVNLREPALTRAQASTFFKAQSLKAPSPPYKTAWPRPIKPTPGKRPRPRHLEPSFANPARQRRAGRRRDGRRDPTKPPQAKKGAARADFFFKAKSADFALKTKSADFVFQNKVGRLCS